MLFSFILSYLKTTERHQVYYQLLVQIHAKVTGREEICCIYFYKSNLLNIAALQF